MVDKLVHAVLLLDVTQDRVQEFLVMVLAVLMMGEKLKLMLKVVSEQLMMEMLSLQ